MHAFIARPFGVKEGIDFETIEDELIGPALTQIGLQWGTTQEILDAGDIREDMFRLLLTADVVIVDVTLHNANVFYELGVRHALRDKRTYLVRATTAEDYPFDLGTERYLEYDPEDPGASVENLARGLRQTLASDDADSPVFAVLPDLSPQDPDDLVAVPAGFHEEVERATKAGEPGDLAMLADEALRFRWAEKGLRVVGKAQFRSNFWEPARRTWERVREYDQADYEANHALATIYQKLARRCESPEYLTRSDQAVERALERSAVSAWERAELNALRGSNAKSRWKESWWTEPEGQRSGPALRSPWLETSYAAYRRGFLADQNHFYSGLNALALLTIRLELSRREKEVWNGLFESDKAASDAATSLEAERERLASAVDLSLAGARPRLVAHGEDIRWLEISKADHACLTSERAQYVASLYERALVGSESFYYSSTGGQLDLYERLGILEENVAASLEVVEKGRRQPEPADSLARVLLFTGHRVDAPDRPPEERRFPRTTEAEETAREMIAQAVDEECEATEGRLVGLAGGASGGDILFHELCRSGRAACGGSIPTQMFLAGPRDAFVQASVADGGAGWVERFDRLYEALPSRVLVDTTGELHLPRWLSTLEDYSIWQRNNLWMLHNALAHGAQRVSLIALWNGEGGDGPGGTAHMVELARQRGAKVVVLPAERLLEEVETK